jgi:hypothetical protein
MYGIPMSNGSLLAASGVPKACISIGWNIFGYRTAKQPKIMAKTTKVLMVVISILTI